MACLGESGTAKQKESAMKRYMHVLLGLAVMTAIYFLPERQVAEAKQILEVMVVLHLCLEVAKKH
jgi:hypothetical protein